MKKSLLSFLSMAIVSVCCTIDVLALSIDFTDVINNEVIDQKYAPDLTLASIKNNAGVLNTLPVETTSYIKGIASGGGHFGVSSESSEGILLTFGNLMSSVTLVGFDWGGDENTDNETMYLSAFDQNGLFLGGGSYGGGFNTPNTRTGTLTYNNIKHMAFTFGNTTIGFYGIDSINASEMNSAPVPEPATMLLVGFGVAGIASINRRKIRKK